MSSYAFLIFCLELVLVRVVFSQVFVGSNSSESAFAVSLPAPGDVSNSCNATFTSDVTCNTVLPAIAFGGYFPSNDDLTALCTSGCLQSLENFRQLQSTSCTSDVMILSGDSYPITATVDALLWTYNYTCRRDFSSQAFCAPIFDSWANGTDSANGCSDCVLGTYQLQLENQLGYDNDLAQSFTSLTSSCQATGYPVSSPPSNSINQTGTATTTSASPTATKPCSGTYTVKTGDDCHSISLAQQISTSNLLYLNNLEAGCTNFPGVGSQLCLPHSCDTYTVKTNDTCYGITSAYNGSFTTSQLISWNIDISRSCGNIDLLVGSQICVSFPGDLDTATATASPSMQTQAPVPTNVVEGTNTQCGKYYNVRGGDTCASITQIQGISLADFYFLNPEINSTSCNNLYLGYSYCVQAVGDIATYQGYGGQPTNPCVGGTTAAPSSCYATTYSTASIWTFPAVNTTSNGTSVTSSNYTSYVITPVSALPVSYTGSALATPTPYQSGMVSGCTDFYSVQTNDTCYDIAQRWSISLDDFYAWNPALKTDCSGLVAGDYVCTSRGNSSLSTTTSQRTTTQTSTTPTSTTGGTPPPGPTQAGIAPDCDKWVSQKDGVYCYDMAQSAGISLPCLYQMNPALNTTAGECQGLYQGYAYCIGTASNECS